MDRRFAARVESVMYFRLYDAAPEIVRSLDCMLPHWVRDQARESDALQSELLC